ncbi:MAG: hypothetical protein HYZ72_19910 [Deltaproteobacteria bacterium]|nr:hypothetical protein [Deltaproteobacteria bacterium]
MPNWEPSISPLPSREEQGYGKQARETAAELAMHFEWGWDYRRAVRYLRQAGENALRRSAHREAIAHLTKGLELLKTWPDTPERAQQELLLQTVLGPALIATKGFAAPGVEKAYTRARALCRQAGEAPRFFPVLRGLAAFYSVRAEYKTALELGEQLLALAQGVQDAALLIEAHWALGPTLFHLEELVRAREHFEQGIALYDPQQLRSHAFLYYRQDPGVTCLSRAAHVSGCWVVPIRPSRRASKLSPWPRSSLTPLAWLLP